MERIGLFSCFCSLCDLYTDLDIGVSGGHISLGVHSGVVFYLCVFCFLGGRGVNFPSKNHNDVLDVLSVSLFFSLPSPPPLSSPLLKPPLTSFSGPPPPFFPHANEISRKGTSQFVGYKPGSAGRVMLLKAPEIRPMKKKNQTNEQRGRSRGKGERKNTYRGGERRKGKILQRIGEIS